MRRAIFGAVRCFTILCYNLGLWKEFTCNNTWIIYRTSSLQLAFLFLIDCFEIKNAFPVVI